MNSQANIQHQQYKHKKKQPNTISKHKKSRKSTASKKNKKFIEQIF